jgi:hypothetical protein
MSRGEKTTISFWLSTVHVPSKKICVYQFDVKFEICWDLSQRKVELFLLDRFSPTKEILNG